MGLEKGLGGVKDELQMFIESQKRKIDHDKRELRKAQDALSPRDTQSSRISDDEGQRGYGYRKTSQGAADDYQAGLPLGEYENRKKAIRDERVRDYKKFAAEKELRRTGKINPSLLEDVSPNTDSRKGRDETTQRNEVTTPDIVDAYAALLRKKRAEERAYRENFDDPEVTSGRKVRFDESENESYSARPQPNINDEELFQWARDKAKPTQRQHSAGEVKTKKSNEAVDEGNTRAKSVPPTTAAGIFGEGGGGADDSRRKKEQYKKDLEMQIKEKEEMKQRERLKKLGRITSSDELIALPKKEEPAASVRSVTPENRVDDRHVDLASGSRSGSRSQGRPRYEDDYNDPRFGYQRYPGMPPYQGMGRYDPYMQMMTGRFDPRMDPFLMQNAGYPGFPGYSGMMYGPNAGMMPRPGRFDDGRDGDLGGGRTSRRESQPRAPRSPRNEASVQESSFKASDVKSKNSPRGNAATAGVFGDDTVDKSAGRAAKLAYQEELKKQMQEKQAAKEKEKKEREKYEAKIEAEIAKYDPWGRAGGGAPVKDQSGHLVADLRTLHKYNEDGVVVSPRIDPGNLADLPKDSPVLAALNGFQNIANASPNSSPRGDLDKQAQGRGVALMELQGKQKDPTQKKEQQQYQDFLRQQIEDKKRLKEEEERKQKEEEQKENRRLEQQRLKMEREFLLEQKKEKKKEEEVRQKNDEMRKVAEIKRHEAEKEKKEMQADRFQTILKRSSELREQDATTSPRDYSRPASRQLPTLMKKQTTEQDQQRPPSRPVPALAKKQNIEVHMESHATQVSNPPSRQNGQSRYQFQSSESSDQANLDMHYLKIIRQQLVQANSEQEAATSKKTTSQNHVIKQLAVLRKQLSTEEQKVQKELEKNVEKYQETRSKNTSIVAQKSDDHADIFEKARIRRGSAKRRAPQRHTEQFNKLTDASSVMDLKSKFPNKPVTSSELDLQQREFMRLQEQKLHALREAIKDTSDYLMLNIDSDNSSSTRQRRSSKQSLLDSDSQFIRMEDQSARLNSRLSTAQSNRRHGNEEDEEPYEARAKTPGGYSIGSMTSQAIEEMAAKNEQRLKNLQADDDRDVATPEDPERIIEKYLKSSSQGASRPATGMSEKSLPSNSALK